MLVEITNRFFIRVMKYIKGNQLVVGFLAVFSVGIIFGALSLQYLSSTDVNLSVLFEQFIMIRTKGFTSIFLNSLFTCIFPLFLLYCFGLFVYGYVPCFIVMFVHGVTHGIVCGYTYTTYGLKGAAFVLLVVFPAAFLITIAQIIGSKASVQFSVLLSKTYFRDTVLVQPSIHLKRYHYQYLILTGFVIVAALADSLLSNVFVRVFGF